MQTHTPPVQSHFIIMPPEMTMQLPPVQAPPDGPHEPTLGQQPPARQPVAQQASPAGQAAPVAAQTQALPLHA